MFEIDKSDSNPFAYATKEMVLNLRKIQCALLQVFAVLLGAWISQRKLTFVQ